QAEDGIRDFHVTGVQTCALPICSGTSGPLQHLSRVALTLLLGFGLAACAAMGPQDPGGPLSLLPDTEPVGTDPSGGGACVVAGEIGRASCRERARVVVGGAA